MVFKGHRKAVSYAKFVNGEEIVSAYVYIEIPSALLSYIIGKMSCVRVSGKKLMCNNRGETVLVLAYCYKNIGYQIILEFPNICIAIQTKAMIQTAPLEI